MKTGDDSVAAAKSPLRDNHMLSTASLLRPNLLTAGELASALSLMSIEAFLLNTLKRFSTLRCTEEQTVLQEFEAAVRNADARLFEEAAHHPELLGMGTTLTMAFVIRRCLFIAHAGDSRCYLYAGGQLRQITRDHTMVAEMVRQIREVEAALGDGVKLGPSSEEQEMHEKARRSLIAARRIPKGTQIERDMIVIKRPGYGIRPKLIDLVIGRVAKMDIDEDTVLTWEML